jgi:hypothetical protein
MREYKNIITLTNNSRGIWTLDPTIGCNSGMKNNEKGCYNDCYAARYSKKYGYDFSKTVLRSFKDEKHIKLIVNKINKIDMPFIRMGTSGDPSENWEHTFDILENIKDCNKEIVIITKHWNNIPSNLINKLLQYNVCINTSVSALDDIDLLNNGLKQYERLKNWCNSILRVVSCDFNLENDKGIKLNQIQEQIFKKYNVLDTVFRVSKNNSLVKEGIINISETKFLGKKCNVSKYNRKAYFGNCQNCLEKCGINM